MLRVQPLHPMVAPVVPHGRPCDGSQSDVPCAFVHLAGLSRVRTSSTPIILKPGKAIKRFAHRCGHVQGVVCVKTSWQLRIPAYEGDSVIPAKAGIQRHIEAVWIPACAGMTGSYTIQHIVGGSMPSPENLHRHKGASEVVLLDKGRAGRYSRVYRS